jgi:hypothetical protein
MPDQPTVPREFAGKWIAWNREMTQVIGVGSTPREARDLAIKAGETHPILGKSPPAHVRLIGTPPR